VGVGAEGPEGATARSPRSSLAPASQPAPVDDCHVAPTGERPLAGGIVCPAVAARPVSRAVRPSGPWLGGVFVAVWPKPIAVPLGGGVVSAGAEVPVEDGEAEEPTAEEPTAEERAVEGPAAEERAVEERAVEVSDAGAGARDCAWAREAAARMVLAALLDVVAVAFAVRLTAETVSRVEVETALRAEAEAASGAEAVVCVTVAAVVLTPSTVLDAAVSAAALAVLLAPSAATVAVLASAPAPAARVAPAAAPAGVPTPSAALATSRPACAWPVNVSAPTLQRSTAPVRRVRRAKCFKRSSIIASFGDSRQACIHALFSSKLCKNADFYG
jgi:hypothetical protein